MPSDGGAHCALAPHPLLIASIVLSGLVLSSDSFAGGSAAVFENGFESPSRIAPMPLISRARPTTASSGNAQAVVDGHYYGGFTWDVQPTPMQPAWVAIDLGSGPSRAMLNWNALPGTEPLRAYRIETSADSTNGANGQWTLATTINDNVERWRAHVFGFSGQRWVRFVALTPGDGTSTVWINEIDVHDASLGNSDSWIFLGDSITAGALNHSGGDDSFPERVHAALPSHFPLMIGAGEGGANTEHALENIERWLAAHPQVQNWVVSYGTNDSANGDPQYAAIFETRLRALVTRVQQAGKTVYLPRIPWKTGGESYLPVYNAALDKVRAELGAFAGPDLYAHFLAHPEQLGDGVHPNEAGNRAMNHLWADAVMPAYAEPATPR